MVDGISNNGVSAYQTAQKLAGIGNGTPVANSAVGASGGSFADMLAETATELTQTLKAGETATIAAARGEADITDVVTAVKGAELTLQTMMTVRDRVIAAYQDIMRMPI